MEDRKGEKEVEWSNEEEEEIVPGDIVGDCCILVLCSSIKERAHSLRSV